MPFLHHYIILKALFIYLFIYFPRSDFTPFTQTVYKNVEGINDLWDAAQVSGRGLTKAPVHLRDVNTMSY